MKPCAVIQGLQCNSVTGDVWHTDETNYLSVGLVWPEVDDTVGEEKVTAISSSPHAHLVWLLKTTAVPLNVITYTGAPSTLKIPIWCKIKGKKKKRKRGGKRKLVQLALHIICIPSPGLLLSLLSLKCLLTTELIQCRVSLIWWWTSTGDHPYLTKANYKQESWENPASWQGW